MTAEVTTAPGPGATLRADLPRARGAVTALGPFFALLLGTAAVVLGHDGLVVLLDRGGDPWIPVAVERVMDVPATATLTGVTILLAVLGLVLLLIGVLPRRRIAVATGTGTGQYLRAQDLARLAGTAARSVDGILRADASASRRLVAVRVRVLEGEDPTAEVTRVVTAALGPLDPMPRVRVTRRVEKDTRRVR